MNRGGIQALRRIGATSLLCAAAVSAQAQSVTFSGMLGDRALLIIDGQAQTVAVGATKGGVKLVKLDGNIAQIEAGGKTQSLRLGGAAVVAGDTGGNSSGSRIVLPAGSGGHFTGLGTINGHSIRFVIDTGATSVSMGIDEAVRLGLDVRSGTATGVMTANGAVAARSLSLASVRVGDVTVYNVQATVVPQSMPYILLGNSFLSRFQMHSDNDTLVLDKKN